MGTLTAQDAQAETLKRLRSGGFEVLAADDHPDVQALYGPGAYKRVNGRKRHRLQTTFYSDSHEIIDFNAQSGDTVSSLRTGSGRWVFRPNKTGVGFIDEAYLIVTITNSDGSNAVVPMPTRFFVDKAETKHQGVVIQEWGNPDINFHIYHGLFKVIEEKTFFAAYEGYTFGTGTSSLAAGATRELWYRIEDAFWIQHRMPYSEWLEDPEHTFYLRNAVRSGTGVLDLASVRLRFKEDWGMVSDRDAAIKRYTSNLESPLILHYQHIPLNVTLTRQVNNIFQLTAARILSPAVLIFIRTSAAQNVALSTTSLNETNENEAFIEFLDNQRQPFRKTRQNLRWQRMDQFSDFPNANEWRTDFPGVYIMNFSNNLQEFVQHKSLNGAFLFTGDQYINIVPASGFSNGSYIIDLYFLTWQQYTFIYDKGLKFDSRSDIVMTNPK
jgi:hypothetical protein